MVLLVFFAFLEIYLNSQNNQADTQLGNIYMSNINERVSKHFDAISDQCLTPMATFAETTPPMCEDNKDEYYKWMTYYSHSRNYDSVSWIDEDGNIETIYGEPLQYSTPAIYLDSLKNVISRVAVGSNAEGKQVMLMCAPVRLSIPGIEKCVAMIGELPITYLSEILSLEEGDALVYSIVIRKDNTFVVHNYAASLVMTCRFS